MLCSGPACSVGCTVPSSVQSSSSVRTAFSLPVNPTLNPTSFLASFPSSSSPGPSYSLVALSILAQSESRFRVLLSPPPPIYNPSRFSFCAIIFQIPRLRFASPHLPRLSRHPPLAYQLISAPRLSASTEFSNGTNPVANRLLPPASTPV